MASLGWLVDNSKGSPYQPRPASSHNPFVDATQVQKQAKIAPEAHYLSSIRWMVEALAEELHGMGFMIFKSGCTYLIDPYFG